RRDPSALMCWKTGLCAGLRSSKPAAATPTLTRRTTSWNGVRRRIPTFGRSSPVEPGSGPEGLDTIPAILSDSRTVRLSYHLGEVAREKEEGPRRAPGDPRGARHGGKCRGCATGERGHGAGRTAAGDVAGARGRARVLPARCDDPR